MASSNPAPGTPTTERVRGIFSNIAPGYDRFNRLASMGIDILWRKQLVKACALTPGMRVLDLAAGTGDVSLALAEQGRPAEVVVTDFTPEMLEIAEKKAAEYSGPTLLTFAHADAQALPFEDASFDVVTVAFGVRNFPERRRNFAEVLRVLKPGGRYVILEFSRPPFAPWRSVYHVYLHHVIPALGGAVAGSRQDFEYLRDSIRQFPDQAALAAELRETGFSAISWKDMTGGIVALHTAVK